MILGRIMHVDSNDCMVREADGVDLENGDLLVCGDGARQFLLQVTSKETGTVMDRRTLEVVTGVWFGGDHTMAFYEPGETTYNVVHTKHLATIAGGAATKPKSTPPIFLPVQMATAADLSFLPGPGPGRIFLGDIRSGSKTIQGAGLYMEARSMIPHHMLVPATTGRGKSNLVKCMVHGLLDAGGVGALVLDPHGEYHTCMTSHKNAGRRLRCYSPGPGHHALCVNVRSVNPHHFNGVVQFSESQERMMWDLWRVHRTEWIPALLDPARDDDVPEQQRITRVVLRQKVKKTLNVGAGHTFADEGGETTISDMVRHVAGGGIIILDTSGLPSSVEMMVGCMAASSILYKYQSTQERLPPVCVVLEEAPRLLAEQAGGNPFGVIAREGRKFGVGICAITQLCSVIPREIMANLNTKIILGNEMRAERDAIISGAAQDLSDDHHTIASLNAGEAIVSSVFVPFAVPIKVPLFDDIAPKRPRLRVVG